MEEDASSMASNTDVRNLVISDQSNSALGAKRPRLWAAKFKGVVPQANGNWGAQIYANHQRIWLGTFKSEREAAMAYDSAAIRLRSGDSHRNFPWTEANVQEPRFQSEYSSNAILNMIKDGSYQSKFSHFIANLRRQQVYCPATADPNALQQCVQLFHKELTPSDVGKLNRLVIPKKFALEFFPYINETDRDGDVEIVFYDRLTRMWKFRYCYWKSSQSFVFTRGWNRFVKEKKLKEKDVVTFYACGQGSGSHSFFLIDSSHSHSHSHSGEETSHCLFPEMGINIFGKRAPEPVAVGVGEGEMELDLNLGVKFSCISMNHRQQITGLKSRNQDKGFRLFGFNIN